MAFDLPTVAAPPSVHSGTEARILDQDAQVETRVVGLWRARISHPQRLSVGMGALIVRQPAAFDCTSACEYRGWLVQAEPGLSGGQLAVGYSLVVADKRRREHFLSRVYLGYGVRGVLLRTWDDVSLQPADRTLAGVEGEFTIIGVNFTLGVLRDLGSGDQDQPWVLSGGIGWGF